MKSRIALGTIAVAMLFAISANTIFAQDDTAATPTPKPRGIFQQAAETARNIFTQRQENRQEKIETRQENREDRLASRSAKRAEVRENIQEKRQEVRAHVAEVHAKRLEKRFEVYGKRLESIIERLQARIDILQTNGKDTTAAQAKLDEAESALTQAKTKANSAVSTFESVDPDQYEAQRSLALQAADIAKEAREDFQEVQSLLKEVVALLKAL